MATLSWEQYSEKQRRAALRVLDSLDQLDSRLDPHYSGKRKHRRVAFRALGRLCCPGDDATIVDPASLPVCEVWIRALSQSGLSFVCPFEVSDRNVVVGLQLPRSDSLTWFAAEVVRARAIPEEGFWEHGVKFVSRAGA